MMRLDKYLAHTFNLSRNDARIICKKGLVLVNQKVIKDSSFNIDETKDEIIYQEQIGSYEEYVYYLFNKPAGCVTSNNDGHYHYVMEYFNDVPNKNELFPVGRLDLDSTGLLLITNDGPLSHQLLSPKSHVEKTYEINTLEELTDYDIDILQQGIMMDKKMTLPCTIKRIDNKLYHITIKEGRYHQVKRMLEFVNNKVLTLKRISFGSLILPNDLPYGEYIKLTKEEIEKLKNN